MQTKDLIPPQKLDELVHRIVSSVHPQRILLFGSMVHGQMGPHSDLDILVVMPDGIHRRQTASQLYHDLWGFGFAKDLVIVTESDVRQHADNPYMVIKSALQEGRELYRAA